MKHDNHNYHKYLRDELDSIKRGQNHYFKKLYNIEGEMKVIKNNQNWFKIIFGLIISGLGIDKIFFGR